MKISKLEIVGFKSFQDKAAIAFPPGISAIVGPNGCGKSNVIDALRWVMGEQSVKTLRGKAMEDIIFAGANGKPPLNMAEVTLTMANDNGHAPEEFRDYAEISVTRRLFRSGESAYLINKQPCRLKDIYNLFMGSGVGSRTFAIIQQGNIGAIIDAGPDERRLFLEEAAGVTRYKFRKNEALRKVHATEQNMLRLNDIISEVNRQMAGLHRQAKKAERYKQYQERVKLLDAHLLLHYYDTYNRQIQETDQLLRSLKDQELNHTTQLKKIDAAVEEIKLKRWQKNQEIASQKNDRHEAQRAIDRAEAERKHAKTDIERLSAEIVELEQARITLQAKTATIGAEVEQIESANKRLSAEAGQIKTAIEGRRAETETLQRRIALLSQQIEEQKKSLMHLVAEEARLKNIYHNASTNKENLKRRLKRIDEEVALAAKKVAATTQERNQAQTALDRIKADIADLETRIQALKEALGARTTELGAQVKQTQSIELERNKNRAQLTTLKKMAANFEWYRDGVKAVMRAATADATPDPARPAAAPRTLLSGIVGMMADTIEPAPGYETAVEAALGEALQFILVENQTSAQAAIDYLQAGGAGRCGFIPIDTLKPLCGGMDTDAWPIEQRLLDHVTIHPGHEPVARALLGHVAVADGLADAVALFNRNGRLQSVVTHDGDLISHQGTLVGGSREQLSGILAKKQELKALSERAAHLDSELAAAQQRQQALEQTVRQLESQLQQHLSHKQGAAEEALEAEKKLYRLSEDLKNAHRHHEIVELEQEQLIGEESDIDEEMAKYNQALSKISAEVEESQNRSSSGAQELGQVSEQLAARNQTVVDLKLQLTAANAKLENGLNTLRRLKEFESDSHQRLNQLAGEIVQKTEKRAAGQSKLSAAESTLQQMYKTLQGLEEMLSTNESEYSAIDSVLNEHDQRLAAIQSERENTLEKMRVVELDLSEKRIMRDNVAGRAMERHHVPMANLRAQLARQDEALQMSVEEMEKELEHFRGKMSDIGDVNLSAITEYDALKQRFDFLSAQRDDLAKAIEDLHKVIRKINRITQERFMETFEAVNAKLSQVFPKLFEGGSARLELTEPTKPLETGVEYMVHPPGKKLTRMSLLSGGEKALSAIAFIFAIFLMRPASFCLLDEIDAPLDEANVVRFNNLMQVIGQKSQIVMITHNKKSMEFADMLFGVTMEHKGISKVVSVNLQGRQN